MQAFHDIQESLGVDNRLRIGETLFLLLQEMTKHEKQAAHKNLRVVVIHNILQSTNAVAGRRIKRIKERDDEKKKERLEKSKKRAAESAWGGEVPELPTEEPAEDGRGREPHTGSQAAAPRRAGGRCRNSRRLDRYRVW